MKRIIAYLLLISPFILSAQPPLWIWPDKAQINGDVAYFRKAVDLPAGKVKSAKLEATADNGFTLFVNGKQVLKGGHWGDRKSTRLNSSPW